MLKIYLITGFLVFTHALSWSQSDITITYEAEKESLAHIFEDLENQYGIRFSFATAPWMSERMDASFEDEPLESVLDYLLTDQDMEFKIVADNILVRKTKNNQVTEDDNYNSILHIKGKVNEIRNDTQLEYATVSIENSNIGTYTDKDGRFDLEVHDPKEDSYLVVSYVGYEPVKYKLTELDDSFLMVALTESSYAVEEVMIVNREKPVRISGFQNATTLSRTQISNRTSGIFGDDINRNIQLLPGVNAHDDDSAEIKIRGSNSDETLMILDGMPIYNANHYYGIFSTVNAGYIDSVNIFKNTYPIQYAGKTAGLVEMYSDKKVAKDFKADIDINFLTASLSSSIPISKNSSISIAGRSTIKEISNNQFNTIKGLEEQQSLVQNFGNKLKNKKNNPQFSFYDFNVQYIWRPFSKSKLSVNLFRSSDKLNNNYDYKIIDDRDNEVNLNVREKNDWSTTAASVLWSQSFNKNVSWNSRAYYSNYKNKEIDEIGLGKRIKNNNGPPINNPNGVNVGADQNNNLLDIGIDNYVDIGTDSHKFRIGATVSQQEVDYEFVENNQKKLFGNEAVTNLTGYGSYILSYRQRLNIDLGMKVSKYSHMKKVYLAPQALINYKLSDKISLKGSVSYYQQVIRQLYYEYRGVPMQLWVTARDTPMPNQGNDNIPVLKSTNMMVGGTVRLGGFTLDVEAYRKEMDGVVEYAVLNPGDAQNNPEKARDYRLFTGEGLVNGIDVILSTGYKNYDTYISYTLSKSQERYPAILQNRYFPSVNDRLHQFKWVNTYQTKNWTFGVNSIFSSGRRYTDVTSFDVNGNITETEADRRFKRLPPYIRVDANVGYNFKIGKFDSELVLSVFNLFDTNNVKYIQSVTTQLTSNSQPVNTVIGNESALLNRTYNVGFNIKF